MCPGRRTTGDGTRRGRVADELAHGSTRVSVERIARAGGRRRQGRPDRFGGNRSCRPGIERARFGAVQSILVARNGFLVYEKYYQGGSRDRLFPLFSATKGVTSALLGIANDNGHISDLSTPVVDIFSEKGPFEQMDARKQSITLNDVLQMRFFNFTFDRI